MQPLLSIPKCFLSLQIWHITAAVHPPTWVSLVNVIICILFKHSQTSVGVRILPLNNFLSKGTGYFKKIYMIPSKHFFTFPVLFVRIEFKGLVWTLLWTSFTNCEIILLCPGGMLGSGATKASHWNLQGGNGMYYNLPHCQNSSGCTIHVVQAQVLLYNDVLSTQTVWLMTMYCSYHMSSLDFNVTSA